MTPRMATRLPLASDMMRRLPPRKCLFARRIYWVWVPCRALQNCKNFCKNSVFSISENAVTMRSGGLFSIEPQPPEQPSP